MNRAFRTLASCLAIVPASAGLAQEAPPAPGASETIEQELEPQPAFSKTDTDEITVIGIRSSVTDVQNDARAITAFSMDELDRANIINVDRLAFNVPALHVGQLGSESIITLRGIGTENSSITGEPGLAFHVDGVNYVRPAAARVSFFDLEGLQVLRGPQGTEGGKNATAGWIHVVTAKPHGEFEVTGDVQWGNYNARRVRAAVNLPLSEFVQTRFALYYENRDGYQDNLVFNDDDRDAFDADDFGWRAHLRLVPRADLDVLLTYNFYESKGVGPVPELIPLPPTRQCTPPPIGPGRILTVFPPFAVCRLSPNLPATEDSAALRPHEIYLDRASGQDNLFWGATSTIQWDVPELPLLGETALRSIGSFQRVDLDSFRDLDATDRPDFFGDRYSESKQWSQELQWTGSTLDERLSWQLSALYMRDTSDSEIDFLARLQTLRGLNIDQETQNTSYGLALSTSWQLRDDVTVSIGGRYTKDQKRTSMVRDNQNELFGELELTVCNGGDVDLAMPGERPDGIPDGGIPWCEQTYRHTTGDLTLEWWALDQNLLYAKIASGFKSGGFAAFDFGLYEPEQIWSYALGTKNSFLDERVTLNMEAFFYHYRDLQLVLVDGLSVRTDNADAEIAGIDLEFTAEPLDGLRLDGNVSYLDTELTNYVAVDPGDNLIASLCKFDAISDSQVPAPGCVLTDYSGNELSRAPEWSLTLGAEYEFFLGGFGSLTPRVQYYWQDDTWYRPFNRTPENSGENSGFRDSSILQDLQESYHQTDVKLIWSSAEEFWSAEVFVQNAEDEAVYQNVLIGSPALGSPAFAWYGNPRVYGFRIGFRY